MKRAMLSLAVLGLAACSTLPPGPRVSMMPAPGKPIEQFSADDQYCRRYAAQSDGLAPSDAGTRNFAASAAVGTAIGAVAGAAIGGNHEGAEKGAALGMLTGAAVGAQQGSLASREMQRRYDIAYQQCMTSKGNPMPGYGAPVPVAPPIEAAPYPPPPPGKR